MNRFDIFSASKVIVGAITVTLAGALLTAPAEAVGRTAGEATSTSKHDKPRLDQAVTPHMKGKLKVCTTGDYIPLTFRNPATGKYSGIDIDMARNLASYLRRTVQFVPTTFATLAQDITTPGKCDIAMGGISITPERQQVADFSIPYLTTGKIPVTTTANEQRFQTIDDINQPGVRLIVNSGGQNQAYAEETFPNATLTVWPDNDTIFGELLNGDADVFVTDSIEGLYQAQQNPGLVAVNPDQPFTTDHKAYMLPKNSPLLKLTNKWLRKVLNNGTFQRYYDSWIMN
ncbi:transporter substrate-binding domain-containing protein [Streptomyces sp. NPDC002547]